MGAVAGAWLERIVAGRCAAAVGGGGIRAADFLTGGGGRSGRARGAMAAGLAGSAGGFVGNWG